MDPLRLRVSAFFPASLAMSAWLCVCPSASAISLVRPAAVPFASGPAFPLAARNGNAPDPRYAAQRAIDGDPQTFCCLLDDTPTGSDPATIPARAAAPVTGHVIFDLGRPMVVLGARLTGRADSGRVNPRDVDFFFFAGDNPGTKARADLEHDSDLRPLATKQIPPLAPGAGHTVLWDGLVARWIGLRVRASYESGPRHYNFQLAEVEFLVGPAKDLAPGSRLPPLYARRATLAETLLSARARYSDWFGTAPSPDPLPLDLSEPIWAAAKRDFPAPGWPLLDRVPAEWLSSGGWLARVSDTKLEQQFIRKEAAQCGPAAAILGDELQSLLRDATRPEDARWLALCEKTAALAQLTRELASLLHAIEDLDRSFGDRYQGPRYLDQLRSLEGRLLRLARGPWKALGPEAAGLRGQLGELKYESLVAGNPLVSPGKLLFVKRYTYTPGWYYAEFMRASRFGGGLYTLSLPDRKVTEVAPQLSGGIFDRYDLSFDGRRMLFGYKSAPGRGFRLYEVGIDGRDLRQLTFDPPDEPDRVAKYWHPAYKTSGVYRHHTDDFHPCYLPDGGIAFASSRCQRGVLCDQSDSLAVNTLFRIEADGSRLRPLSQNPLSESTPSVANDGRILYTRWEYVDKGVIAVQALWAMRPDGTGAAEIYGDDVELPPVLIHGRAIPGLAGQFVATATMHHPFAVGPILLIDGRRSPLGLEPIRSLTPDTDLLVEGKDGRPHSERFAHWSNGRLLGDNKGPLFSEPYPLADPLTGAGAGKYFLVDCNPDQPWGHASAYGLWLIDVFGNRVPIYSDPQISCWQPMPLRTRPRPPVISSPVADQPTPEGTLLLADVYLGLSGIPRGTVKYLRVLEQVARPWSARRFWPDDSAFGQHAPVSLCSHIHVKVHHGVVPVCADGSAHFTVPAQRNLFFQALDENFMELQRMRTFVNLQPGETRSCVGCHDYRRHAPAGPMPLAATRAPIWPAPQPGESVPRPIHYTTDVQPILDRHCTACHGPQRRDAELDLSGEPTQFFNRSYEALFRRRLLSYVQEFHGPQPDAQVTNVQPLPAKALGSHSSRLVQILRGGHYDVKLTPAEWASLITWVDANGPYYGTYFGRRNLVYKDHPDFRPTPTLQSALGLQ